MIMEFFHVKFTQRWGVNPAPEDIVVDEGGQYRLSDGSLCVLGYGLRGTLRYVERIRKSQSSIHGLVNMRYILYEKSINVHSC